MQLLSRAHPIPQKESFEFLRHSKTVVPIGLTNEVNPLPVLLPGSEPTWVVLYIFGCLRKVMHAFNYPKYSKKYASNQNENRVIYSDSDLLMLCYYVHKIHSSVNL